MPSIINMTKLVLTVLPLSLSSSRQCLPLSFKVNGSCEDRKGDEGERKARSRLGGTDWGGGGEGGGKEKEWSGVAGVLRNKM